MFRRLESTLPPDFDFPTNLTELGYFINQNDQIRMIEQPDQPFHYWISKNDRYVQRHREAFHQCLRDLLYERLTKLGLEFTRLPLGTPVDNPHVPIWVSSNISSCKRLILYIGESHQDLGVFAGRIINNDGINEGSALSLVQAAQSTNSGPLPEEKRPGIVIANAGQLLWHRRGKKALSWESWYALKRSSAVGPGFAVTEKNKIPGHETPANHVASVFKEIVLPQGERKCEIFVIAVGDTAHDVFDFLKANWEQCAGKIQGLTILASNYVWLNSFHDEAFMKWFGERGRGYLVSDEPVGTPLQGRSRFGCNLYSGGEPHFVECLMRSAHPTILDYFKLISQVPGYVNVPQDMDQDLDSEPNKEEGGWGDDAQPDEAEQETQQVNEAQDTAPTPESAISQEASAQEPVSALAEGIASLELDSNTDASLQHAADSKPSSPIPIPIDRHVPQISHPFRHSPEESPTEASVYSCATSHVLSTGYATPPERVLPSIEDPIGAPSEDPIGQSIRALVETSSDDPHVTPSTNGLRVLDPNTGANARARSFSAASGTSTASSPAAPAAPNSTPEMGLTPEPDYRIGIAREGSSMEDGQSFGQGFAGGMGGSHGSLIREVLRLGGWARLGADGFYDAEGSGNGNGDVEGEGEGERERENDGDAQSGQRHG